jgi:hypothetical protein
VPDVMLLADAKSFRSCSFRNTRPGTPSSREIVLSSRTRRDRKHASEINAGNWMAMLQRSESRSRAYRSESSLRPAIARCSCFNSRSGTTSVPVLRCLLRHAPESNVRPNAAELAALLEAGELDYIFDYQSVAESNGFRFLILPAAIDPRRCESCRRVCDGECKGSGVIARANADAQRSADSLWPDNAV